MIKKKWKKIYYDSLVYEKSWLNSQQKIPFKMLTLTADLLLK
jgi:hypothetical protein